MAAVPRAVPPPSPEHALLLACGRWVLARHGPPPERALLGGVDPARLAEVAAYHGMLALLGRFLGRFGRDGAPLFATLRGAVQEGARGALALTAELVEVARGLEARGVPVLAYKGPALAIQAFGDASLRRFGDLDLVVEPAALEPALAVLEELGFEGEGFGSEEQRAAVLRDGHHLALTRGRVVVELHWRFSKRIFGFGEELGGVWERRETLEVAGAPVPVLGVGDHMLALVIHASKGVWSVLEWTLAIAALSRAVPADEWEAVAARARRWGCARALQVSLLLADELFAAPVPAGLGEHLPPDRSTRALARRLAALTLSETRSPAGYLRAQLALRRGPLAKLGFLLRSLFVASPEDYAASGGSRRQLGLARLARPFRLLRKYRGGTRA